MKKSSFVFKDKRVLCWIWSLLLLCCSTARGQEVILAFTDVLGPSATLDGMARSQMIISGLRRANVEQAIFFIDAKKITIKTRPRVEQFDKAGHVIASQGFGESLLRKVNVYQYKVDLLKAHALLKPYDHYRGYFWLNYYSSGGDSAIHKQLEEFATENNFTPTYVTLNTYDAYLNQKYIERVNQNKRVDMGKLEEAYLDMVLQGLAHANAYALATIPGNAKHVLLLQENDINAYLIFALVEKLRERGWHIATPDSAFGYPRPVQKPISLQTPEGYFASLSGIEWPVTQHIMSSHRGKADIDELLRRFQLFQ